LLKIGNNILHNGLVLAPLAGITDSSFRRLCKSYGAELVFTEMVSSEGIRRRMRKTLRYLHFTEVERPLGIQIFGSSPESMKEAACIVEEDFHPDILDINLGCSVKKVIKTGAGAALLKDTAALEKVVNGVVSAVDIPVSAKIRLGWKHNNALELSKILENCGVSLLTIHARTAKDGFSKKADWSLFEKIKKNIGIPLIANGDIETGMDASYLLNEIGVDGVMIGRGALGRPWIFEIIKGFLEKHVRIKEPAPKERLDVLLRQIALMNENIGEQKTVSRIKKQLYYYIKGIPKSKEILVNLFTTKSLDGMLSLIHGLADSNGVAKPVSRPR